MVYPDVQVVERPGRGGGTALALDIEVAEPLIILAENEPTTEGFIEIIDISSGSRVVTVIELLSYSNKLPGEGQALYRKKQRECREGGVSLVEIDLLRSGQRVLAVPVGLIPPSHRTTYLVCVTRAWKPCHYEVYPVPLREPLPAIQVPLRETDTDAPLNLQVLIDRCYQNGRYDDTDYQADLQPPLAPEDAAWANELLTAKGLRS